MCKCTALGEALGAAPGVTPGVALGETLGETLTKNGITKIFHTANVWRRNMPLKVKLIFSGSFSESCIFKDFYDCKSVCEYVHHFIHETDDLLIGEFTDMRKFYATHVAEYFDEYVSEHLQSVENSSLNEIFDLIVYVYDDG